MTFIALSSSLLAPNPLPAAIFMAGIATRRVALAVSEGLRKRAKRGTEGERKRKPSTENTQLLPETFANWFRLLSSPLRDHLMRKP